MAVFAEAGAGCRMPHDNVLIIAAEQSWGRQLTAGRDHLARLAFAQFDASPIMHVHGKAGNHARSSPFKKVFAFSLLPWSIMLVSCWPYRINHRCTKRCCAHKTFSSIPSRSMSCRSSAQGAGLWVSCILLTWRG